MSTTPEQDKDGKALQVFMDDILAIKRGETVPDQWEAQILCRILLKHRVIMVTR